MKNYSLLTSKKSLISGLYKMSKHQRLEAIASHQEIENSTLDCYKNSETLSDQLAETFVENSIGTFELPLGIITNVVVNGRTYMVPAAVEESSVIAAASAASKHIAAFGGFAAEGIGNETIGQVHIPNLNLDEALQAKAVLEYEKEYLLFLSEEAIPSIYKRGGGVRDIELRIVQSESDYMLVMHVFLDTCDAMGANLVNTLCESLALDIEEITGKSVLLRILSNLATRRLFRASCKIPVNSLETLEYKNGLEVAKSIEAASRFAESDPFRACTHNKGIMNGISPVVVATGNDWRAVEAGAHAYAAIEGQYSSLSKWRVIEDELVGSVELPLQVGVVGGVTKLHPKAKANLEILGNPSAQELGMTLASTGLASNFAALRALATHGIQKGHMKLHKRNLELLKGAVKEIKNV